MKTSTNSPGLEELPGHAAFGPERRNEGDQDHKAGIDHQTRGVRGSADVLDAIRIGKAQVAVEAMAHIVAIENVRVPAERKQLALQPARDCRLARTGKTREPQTAGLLSLELRALCFGYVRGLPRDVCCARLWGNWDGNGGFVIERTG